MSQIAQPVRGDGVGSALQSIYRTTDLKLPDSMLILLARIDGAARHSDRLSSST